MAGRTKTWTAEEEKFLVESYGRLTLAQIAADLNRGFGSVANKLRDLKTRGVLPIDGLRSHQVRLATEPKEASEPVVEKTVQSDSEEIKRAGMESQLRRLQSQMFELENKTEPKRVPVESFTLPAVSPEERWRRCEEQAQIDLANCIQRHQFKVTFDDPRPIGVTFIGDQHIAPGTATDFKRMREDAELIQSTDGLYACLGGDSVDNHLKIRSAVLHSPSRPRDQWELFDWYLSIFAEKIIAIISGNHDAWTDQFSDVDMVALLAKKQRLCYAPHEARIQLELPGYTYKLAMRHQYRFNSAFNQGHSVKQWWRMGTEPFDVGCLCHLHEAHLETFVAHSQTCWICRPGSYQLLTSYSGQYGFNPSRPTCPTFIFFPNVRRIIGFHDVRDAVKTLESERRA